MKKSILIFSFAMIAAISGTIGYLASANQNHNQKDIRVWYSFTLQTLDFMMDASDNLDANSEAKIKKAILLTLADSAYLIKEELKNKEGISRFRKGVCERLNRIQAFEKKLIEKSTIRTTSDEASDDYIKSTIQDLALEIEKICNL